MLLRRVCSAVDLFIFLSFFSGICTADKTNVLKLLEWDGVRGNEINAHFDLRSFLISYFQT